MLSFAVKLFLRKRVEPCTMTSDSSTSDDYVVKETATLNWTINGFTNLTNYVHSEEFSPPNSKNVFRLFLNSKIDFLDSNDVCFYLWYNQHEDESSMRYRVSIVNANGEKKFTHANGKYKHRNFIFFTSYAECLPFLTNGNLILNCEVDLLEDSKMVSNGQTNLQNDYQSLLENSKFSDAILVVKDKEFKIHKNILAARSKVFEAMFSNDLEEKKQNRVEITDVEVDVFEHLLLYLYTGKILKMDEYGLELFVVADKYQLDHLKSTSEQSLGSTLNVESVVNALVIADMHNASELKSKCIEYINANSVAVKKTEQWKQMKTRPALLMEVYDHLSAKLESMSTKS